MLQELMGYPATFHGKMEHSMCAEHQVFAKRSKAVASYFGSACAFLTVESVLNDWFRSKAAII